MIRWLIKCKQISLSDVYTGIQGLLHRLSWRISSVQFSCSVVSNSVSSWKAAHWASLSITNFHVQSNSCPLSQWRCPTISSSIVLFSFHLQSFRASGSFQMSQIFASDGQRTEDSALGSVLSMNIQDWFPLKWLDGSPWSPRDSQASSSIPQFKSIKSSVLNFLYSPALTSIHDYWKNHSLDKIDLCWQSNVFAF